MPKLKVYRVKKDHVLEIENTNQLTLEMAYRKGYAFVKCGDSFYTLSTNKKRTTLEMQWAEIEFVEGV